jgi:hypothetical protein
MSDIQTPEEGTEQVPVTPEAPAPQVDQEPETPQTPPVEPAAPAAPETPPAPDYKQKFVESSKESILNAERVNIAQSRIEQLTNTDTPTDEAMRLLYPEWDNLDEYNKRVLIRQETTAMQTARILADQQDIAARQKLEDQLDDVIDNSSFAPKLKGKESEFKRFARNPKNRGIAAETLAKAFLFDAEDETPPAPVSTAPEALPAGSGGPREPLKPKKMSIEEAIQLKKTNYKAYMEAVKNKQIEEVE